MDGKAATAEGKAGQALRAGVLLLLVCFLSFIFRDGVTRMVQSWQQEEYSHGYLIPVIALVLFLNKIDDAKPVPRSSWLGCALLLLCVLLQFFLQVAGIRGLLAEIYLISLAGVVLLFWGTASLRLLIGPLIFLMFAAPLPKGYYYTLSFAMQMLSTTLGTHLLELLGVPVFQDGNIIDLGGYKLEVAEACSGLRYLFPLLSLSFLLAYMYRAPFPKRALLFVSAVPIAAVLNGLRIAIIGVTVDRWGPRMAEGVLHDMEGWMIFLGCLLCLLAEVWVLKRVGQGETLDLDCLRLPRFTHFQLPPTGGPVFASVIIAVLGVLCNAWMPGILPGKAVALNRPFTQFPLRLGPWAGHFAGLDPALLPVLGTSDYLLADYAKPDSPAVNLYVLYYAKQDSSGNEAIHNPSFCIPAGGWIVDSTTLRTVAAGDAPGLPVHRLIVSKETAKQIVYYWYIEGGRVESNPNMSKLYQVKDAILKGTTNGAIVRLMTPLAAGESEGNAERRLTDFLRASYGTLNGFMFPARDSATSSSRSR